MAKSTATTVAEYLAGLPAERRSTIAKVRGVIRKHLPKGYRETMNWGVICYEVPLRLHPTTYNGQPLCYAGLAAQKNYSAVYLMCAYHPGVMQNLREGFRKAGKKLNMGRCCIRFQRAEDLPLETIGKAVASCSVSEFVAQAEAAHKH
jgi:hypothetical protein